ncbi:hypothetical protein ACLKMY_16030, partial [Paraburkholderia mimosarum]|uniref:hypothetical protein n=1 Tax=Paraburkholderia mimosarum TaxID=312026 RepID=UPI0039C13E3F
LDGSRSEQNYNRRHSWLGLIAQTQLMQDGLVAKRTRGTFNPRLNGLLEFLTKFQEIPTSLVLQSFWCSVVNGWTGARSARLSGAGLERSLKAAR